MRILITGFEAFHTNDENPTQEVIRLLPKTIKGHQLIGLELPVDYKSSFEKIKSVIDNDQIDCIIMLGLAQGRKHITPERIAVNIDDASIPDNLGVIRSGTKISKSGKNAYFSTLPLDKIVKKLKDKNIPVKISNTAGTYVCNHIMYSVLEYLDVIKSDTLAGFIHVPLMSEQKHQEGHFSLPLAVILESIIDAIKACII